MKPIKTIVLIIGSLFFITLSVNAQDCTCTEAKVSQIKPSTALSVIEEDDFPNFLNVESLKKYSNVKQNGELNPFNITYYVIESHTKRVDLYARYSKKGALINSVYIRKDWPLPFVIRRQLATEFTGWTMTNNKIVVNDFDRQKTEYEVKLRQGDLKQVLFFDHSGNRINKLSRT
ncbi:hypothetical protein NC796_15665 [Aliifodinibius sp. S!AR15-10]|uniref:hypothetical protein n=1 Tax=Aliifodinibius sp. S!AR15-10 TaxID=2950437 RepID=UPI00286158B9|nr:hypothetical protein [Aliifodinibius sp. S!AR15-10]MDR8392593.1 hypothetical protein [Aliifodinibius sp. S!AR15-10]